MDYIRKEPLDYADITENLRDPAWYDIEEPDSCLLSDAATAITDLLARAEAAEKERDEEKSKVDEYAASARAIALWLAGFCDKSLSYPQMISNAARKIALAYADMEKRAEEAEAREKSLQEAIQMVTARAEKAERERDAYKEMICKERPCAFCAGYTGEWNPECLKCDHSTKGYRPKFRLKGQKEE